MAGQNTVLLDVKGMTCQGCVNSVTRIIKRNDANALVSVDLPSGRVTAQTGAPADELAAALSAGGFEAKAA
jgi:copper chaperone